VLSFNPVEACANKWQEKRVFQCVHDVFVGKQQQEKKSNIPLDLENVLPCYN